LDLRGPYYSSNKFWNKNYWKNQNTKIKERFIQNCFTFQNDVRNKTFWTSETSLARSRVNQRKSISWN